MKEKSFIHDGNRVAMWIMMQSDLWIEDKSAFHIGDLQQRWLATFEEEYRKEHRDWVRRIIALEAFLARHVYAKQQQKVGTHGT